MVKIIDLLSIAYFVLRKGHSCKQDAGNYPKVTFVFVTMLTSDLRLDYYYFRLLSDITHISWQTENLVDKLKLI